MYVSVDDEMIVENCKNLKNHNKIIIGNNYDELNKPCRLLEAIESNLIDLPIALIHPDMILKEPILSVSGDIICSISPDEDEKELETIKNELDQDNLYPFLPVGSIIVFNTYESIDFLRGLIGYYNDLSSKKLVDYEKIALMNNVYNFYDRLAINLQPMESSLLHNNYKSNFIHYKYGIPPSFMKHKFEETDPYEILLNFNSTDNLKYMAQIVEKYLVV